MAEQRVTVKLDPIQVQQLKDFVRDEINKQRQASMRVAAPAPDGMRHAVARLADSIEERYPDPEAQIKAGVVISWLRGMTA
jgi:hypothetical protein